jgi:hypothetical protein
MELGDFGIQDFIDKNFPQGVNVPTGVSEDDAVRAVQEQFTNAGFDCPDETARGLVRHGLEQQGE